MTPHPLPPRGRRIAAFVAFVAFSLSLVVAAFAQERKSFDLPAGPAEQSLKAFASQSGLDVIFVSSATEGITTPEVRGELTPQEALDRLLSGTPLVATSNGRSGGIKIRREASVELAEKNVASRPVDDRAADGERGPITMDTFEVFAGRTLNMDIKRSRDDAQPYVVFGREALERSSATDLQDFLKQRIPMNTQVASNSQNPTVSGDTSTINLRGLGAGQTLILIDGHRAPAVYGAGFTQQPDVNSIPMDMIERIEILPTTASGIYGGSATGGAINIVLRRDYSGAELTAKYENTFHSDASIRRIDLSAGATFERGKSNLIIATSYATTNSLWAQDRDFIQRGRQMVLANNNGNYPSLNRGTSPPLSSTPNIRSTTGANLTLKNGTPLNSPITFIPAGYAGVSTDNGAALVPNAGRYNLDLGSAAMLGGGGRQSLSFGPESIAAMATFRRQISERIQVFAEASLSNRATEAPISAGATGYNLQVNAPNNPFNQVIRVSAPVSGDHLLEVSNRSRRVVAGILTKLPGGWSAEVDYTWGRFTNDFRTARAVNAAGTAALANGSLDVMRDLRLFPIDLTPFLTAPAGSIAPFRSKLSDVTVRGSGPLWSLPAGQVSLATLLERRQESIDEGTFVTATSSIFFPARDQTVDSVYLETTLPIVADANRRTGMDELSLQVAVRRDAYELNGVTGSVVGSTPVVRTTARMHQIDPTIGMRYRPAAWLAVRGSYGTGFLPPALDQLTPDAPQDNAGNGFDPRRNNQILGQYTSLTGGNASLRPEHSESWSAGAIVTPGPGWRISIDYLHIAKRDNIVSLTPQQLLENEAIFGSRIVRSAPVPGDGFSVGPVVQIDRTVINIATAEVEAFDVAVDFEGKLGEGKFHAFALGTWQTHYRTRLVPSLPEVENVGIGGILATSNPLKFKANGGLSWEKGPWLIGWSSRYFNSYQVSTAAPIILSQGNGGRVPSQIYHDCFISYRFPKAGNATRVLRFLSGTEVKIGAKNVFNTEPPFDAASFSSTNYYYSGYGDPRLASYFVSLKHSY